MRTSTSWMIEPSTAFFFGLACGRELRDVVAGRRTPAEAASRYGRFSAAHGRKFEAMLQVQRLIPRVPPRLLARSLRAMQRKQFVDWAFGHYLEIAHPRFVEASGAIARPRVAA